MISMISMISIDSVCLLLVSFCRSVPLEFLRSFLLLLLAIENSKEFVQIGLTEALLSRSQISVSPEMGNEAELQM